ncbi:DNA-binding transcriptional ArsR family regulator [Oceanibaculum indicum]|uniref:DNA-binding transcriptional ArsR family regulator n=2 Tax=Oceanibaculaceae TaxID=3031147 RepID=A0A420WFV9_9PROT|nr:DNA-binding transcriptional ArsR family regulator [Oceanibaculum indicum]
MPARKDFHIYEEMEMTRLSAAAEQASELLKALSNPTRLKILCTLVESEKSVGQIAEALDVRENNVSQHLALLRKDRLVRTRREGQTIYYSIDDPAAQQVIALLHDLFCGPEELSRQR